MPQQTSRPERLAAVPLFPLPNVVLFPRAVLPLHIFEERYKAMTADAIAGDGLIAMALLRPGWEKCYYSRPEIEPVVCIGKILRHERLGDGKYNFLLHGQMRARIVREHGDGTYRVAELEPLVESEHLEIDLTDHRLRLAGLFAQEELANLPAAKEYRKLLNSPLTTAQVADLLAFHLIDDEQIKQSLLAETNVLRRVVRVTSIVEGLFPMLHAAGRQRSDAPSLN